MYVEHLEKIIWKRNRRVNRKVWYGFCLRHMIITFYWMSSAIWMYFSPNGVNDDALASANFRLGKFQQLFRFFFLFRIFQVLRNWEKSSLKYATHVPDIYWKRTKFLICYQGKFTFPQNYRPWNLRSSIRFFFRYIHYNR